MSPRLRGYKSISITVPARILYRIDELADEVQLSRSEVISDLCKHCLDDEEIVNEIYPYEEEEE